MTMIGAGITMMIAAAPANADTTAFLSRVTQLGFVITDTQTVLTLGVRICDVLGVESAEDAAQVLHEAIPDTLTIAMARNLVLAANDELCPWRAANREIAGTKVA